MSRESTPVNKRGRGNSRSRGGGRGGKSGGKSGAPSKSPSKKSKRNAKADESESDAQSTEDDDKEYKPASTPRSARLQPEVVIYRRPIRSTDPPEWVSLEAVDDSEFEEEEEEEEVDEIEDEGEVVDSDIDPVKEPNQIAFTRPSTSPIRRNKKLASETPPTPSPKKETRTVSRKRPAPPSPDVVVEEEMSPTGRNRDTVVEYEVEVVDPDGTPTAAKGKRRLRKPIKSVDYIEDSDIEELDAAEFVQEAMPPTPPRASKLKAVPKSAVIELTRKISVPGFKKFPPPVRDEENNPLLDRDTSDILRSPKKKAKTEHIPSEVEDSEEMDEEDLVVAKKKTVARRVTHQDSDDEDTPVSTVKKGKQPAKTKAKTQHVPSDMEDGEATDEADLLVSRKKTVTHRETRHDSDDEDVPVSSVKKGKQPAHRETHQDSDDEDIRVSSVKKGKQPATPVSRLTAKMSKSILDSNKKKSTSGKTSSRDVARSSEEVEAEEWVSIDLPTPRNIRPGTILPPDIIFDSHNFKAEVSPSLKKSYLQVPRNFGALGRVKHCYEMWGSTKLDEMMKVLSIDHQPERLKRIASIVCVPRIGDLIFNPVRSDWTHFKAVCQRPEQRYREYFYNYTQGLAEDNKSKAKVTNRVCFLVWGCTSYSQLVDGEMLPGGGNMWMKSMAIAPITIEWARFCAFFTKHMNLSPIFISNFHMGFTFSSRPNRPSFSQNRPTAVNDWAVKVNSMTAWDGLDMVEETLVGGHSSKVNVFHEQLAGYINNGGVPFEDTVPIYDLRELYNRNDIRPLADLLATAPRWTEELPPKSFVGVLNVPHLTKHDRDPDSKEGNHDEFRFALIGIILLAIPYN
ncbi:hypothetical protein BDW22DRAFT_1342554 [Trametopsis cervina]|nr:hypothetical protein BDW22DRAFT_1342554 [Trametopsis cervina]